MPGSGTIIPQRRALMCVAAPPVGMVQAPLVVKGNRRMHVFPDWYKMGQHYNFEQTGTWGGLNFSQITEDSAMLDWYSPWETEPSMGNPDPVPWDVAVPRFYYVDRYFTPGGEPLEDADEWEALIQRCEATWGRTFVRSYYRAGFLQGGDGSGDCYKIVNGKVVYSASIINPYYTSPFYGVFIELQSLAVAQGLGTNPTRFMIALEFSGVTNSNMLKVDRYDDQKPLSPDNTNVLTHYRSDRFYGAGMPGQSAAATGEAYCSGAAAWCVDDSGSLQSIDITTSDAYFVPAFPVSSYLVEMAVPSASGVRGDPGLTRAAWSVGMRCMPDHNDANGFPRGSIPDPSGPIVGEYSKHGGEFILEDSLDETT